MSSIIFGQFDAWKDTENKWTTWSRKRNAIFMGLSNNLFALGVGFFLLPLLLGSFKILTSFMIAKFWVVLYRLWFLYYLLHYAILWISIYGSQKGFEYSLTNVYAGAFLTIGSGNICGIIMYCLVLGPTIELKKLLIDRNR